MNPYVNKLKKKLHNRHLTKVKCHRCGSIIKTTDGQTKSCRCGDVTVFQYTEGRYDVAFRVGGAYEVVHEEREAFHESYQEGRFYS